MSDPAAPGRMIDPSLPLIDLHRHLDGNVRLQTIVELADRHGIALPAADVDGLRPHVQVSGAEPGVMAFIARFEYLTAVMVDADACRRIAYENLQDAAEEGIDYVELRFSPWFMAERHGLEPEAVVDAVVDGIAAGARDTGVRVGLIGILSRTYGPDTCMRELEALLRRRDDLVAMDLAGDEARWPAELFAEHFRRGRDAGLRVTVHAGESAGPGSIRAAISELGAERIGHGFAAQHDAALMDLLAARGIGLEVCLTSNLHTSLVADYRDHPARRFLDHGLTVCLNTDDPAISGIDLPHEYEHAAPRAGLEPEHARLSQQHALTMAFLDQPGREALRLARRQRAEVLRAPG